MLVLLPYGYPSLLLLHDWYLHCTATAEVRRPKLGGSIHLTDMKVSTKFQTSDLANDPSRPQWELPASSPTLRGTAREPPRSDVGKWVGWNRTDEGYATVPNSDV